MSWILTPPGQITQHFSHIEAACHCCGRIVSREAVLKAAQMMEAVRAKLGGKPIKVLSWCRCPRHNAKVGGASDSFHMKGLAVDFTCKHLTPAEVQDALKDHLGGLGSYLGFTHIDCRGKRARWTG